MILSGVRKREMTPGEIARKFEIKPKTVSVANSIAVCVVQSMLLLAEMIRFGLKKHISVN
jgi:hypothetical protein